MRATVYQLRCQLRCRGYTAAAGPALLSQPSSLPSPAPCTCVEALTLIYCNFWRTDGRDVNDNTAVAWIERLQGAAQLLSGEHQVDVRIASGGGRMATTMDRYQVRRALGS